ncbi:ATP-binding protein [Alcaligenes sp. SMD-FA]|uniref:ATP-binding protein n=1 Tax=Alcaligenes sp. SMD-FA TaxID=2991054 RepID=UPI002227920D|nr:ATP-binding protein [Alcaligenes sp. SMD-FA]UYY87339.1 ATP-binding protein [Alcaligenes sp. SMD-FA]
MSIVLSRFAIFGLHGKLDIDIPIFDNKLILIGVNGLGKTTVVNFIYFTLTDQWNRLLEYEFSAIEVTINNQPIILHKVDIQRNARATEIRLRQVQRYSSRSPFPPKLVQEMFQHPLYPDFASSSDIQRENIGRLISRETGIPLHLLHRMSDGVSKITTPDLFSETQESSVIAELSALTKANGRNKVIYLPTFRRIEQDIKSVFPNADERELRNLTSAAETAMQTRTKGHVELVQFGMQDVETKIQEELDLIQRRTRAQLTGLTSSYLQDIIRNRAGIISKDNLQVIPKELIPIVLERVDENTLSAQDKREIEAAILRVKNNSDNVDVRDSYLTYFFGRLLEIYQELYQGEENIRELVTTCNNYLESKCLEYNDKDYSVNIKGDDKSPLEWRMLSSGEKQVVSLFTHLYLSKESSQIVLIDEPELSLSVPWQKTLLPDIARTENCSLLIAVTHSPFIYSNELSEYAVDLGRLIKKYDV